MDASSTFANFAELRQKINNWDIDAEALLIAKVKQFSDRYLTQYNELSKNYTNFSKQIHTTEIEHMKSMNMLKKLSLNRFVEHVVDMQEVPQPEPEKQQPSGIIDLNEKTKNTLELSIKGLPMGSGRQNEQDLQSETSSQIGFDNNKNMKLPFIIGTKDFNQDRTAGVAKMANNIDNDLENENLPGLEDESSKESKEPKVITGFIPGKQPEEKQEANNNQAQSSIPQVPQVPSGNIPSVPVPPPMNAPKANPQPQAVPPSVPSVPSVPVNPPQSNPLPPVQMAPNTGGKAVPPPPPLVIPVAKAPVPKQVVQNQPPKPIPPKKPPQKSFQELLLEQMQARNKKKNPPPEENKPKEEPVQEEKKAEPQEKKEPSQPTSSIKKEPLKGKLPTDVDFGEGDDAREDIDILIANPKRGSIRGGLKISESKPKQPMGKSVGIFDMGEEEPQKKPVTQNKPSQLGLIKGKLDEMFKENSDEESEELGQDAIKNKTNDVTKRLNMLTQEKKEPPKQAPPKQEPKKLDMSKFEQPKKEPPKKAEFPNASGNKESFGSRMSNLQNMLAGRLGGGGMKPPENDSRKTQTESTTVIEKPPMETLLEKKTTIVVGKKKPKKKGFGAPAGSAPESNPPLAKPAPAKPAAAKPAQAKPVQSQNNVAQKNISASQILTSSNTMKKPPINLFEDLGKSTVSNEPKPKKIDNLFENIEDEKSSKPTKKIKFFEDDDD